MSKSKFTDILKAALVKKQDQHHNDTNSATVDPKKTKKSVPVITGRPMKKAAGRGR
jgi:hypothetical protein